jgi:hypothetical protein
MRKITQRLGRTIGYLVTELDFLFRIDDDLLLPINRNYFGCTIRIARMINQTPNEQSQYN